MIQRILVVVCGYVLFVLPVLAQDSTVSWETIAGYNFGVPLSIARDAGVVNRYTTDLSGTSADHQVWAGVQLSQPQWLSSHWGWSTSLAFAFSSGSFVSEPFASGEVQNFSSPLTRSQVDISTLVGSAILRGQMQYNIGKRWSAGIGPWLSYRLLSQIVYKERVVAIEDDSGNYVPLGEEEAPPEFRAERSLAASPWRGGLAFSLAYRLPSFTLNSQIEVDAGALLGDNLGIRSTRFGVGVAVPFHGKESQPSVEYIRDTVYIPESSTAPPIAVSAPPTLQAAIQLYSMQSSTRTLTSVPIQKKSTYFKQSSELLPVVFFEDNSAAIPERYIQLQSNQAPTFSRNALARLSPVQIYYHILNILGTRMVDNPTSVVVLTGSTAQKEPTALAQARTESVRNYLRDIWGIEEKRIEMRWEEGKEKSRSVVISSSSVALTEPIVVEWKLQSLAAPPVKLRHTVAAQAGMRSWNLLLTYQGQEVGRYEGTTVQELDSLNLAFNISAGTRDSSLAPLTAVLVVDDNTGATTTATATIPLVWNTSQSVVTNEPTLSSRKENMSAVLFAADTEARLMVRHPLLENLLASVRADARITISSLMYHNKENGESVLLRPDRLAEAILATLKKRDMSIAEMHVQRQGEIPLPLLQGLPEQTLFQSALCVVVEQAEEQY